MSKNPIHTRAESSSRAVELNAQEFKESAEIDRKEILKQMQIPWRKKEHRFDPVFFKCENKKIVKYESRELKIWGVSRSKSF